MIKLDVYTLEYYTVLKKDKLVYNQHVSWISQQNFVWKESNAQSPQAQVYKVQVQAEQICGV